MVVQKHENSAGAGATDEGSAFCTSRGGASRLKGKGRSDFFLFVFFAEAHRFHCLLSLSDKRGFPLSRRLSLFLSPCHPLQSSALRTSLSRIRDNSSAFPFEKENSSSHCRGSIGLQAREAHSLSSFIPKMSAADFANAKGERFAVALLGEDGAPTQNVVVQVREKRGDVKTGSEKRQQ